MYCQGNPYQRFFKYAQENPDKTALYICRDSGIEEYSYSSIEAMSFAVARFLIEKNLEVGDKVVILAKSEIAIVAIFLACMKLGCIPAVISPNFSEQDLCHVLASIRPNIAFVEDFTVSKAQFENLHASVGKVIWFEDIEKLLVSCSQSKIGRDFTFDGIPKVVVNSSGTTSRPKSIVKNMASPNRKFPYKVAGMTLFEDWSEFVATPVISHFSLWNFGGIAWIWSTLPQGAPLILVPQNRPKEFLEALSNFRIPHFGVLPNMLLSLLETLGKMAPMKFYLKAITVGGAACNMALLRRAELEFACPVFSCHSMTEGFSGLTHDFISDLERRSGSCGRISGDGSSRIIHRPDLRDDLYELHISNPSVSNHILKDGVETAVQDSGLKTGDIFSLNDNGSMFFIGRENDFIKFGKNTLSFGEIEKMLSIHPHVLFPIVGSIAMDSAEEILVAAVYSGNVAIEANQIREIFEKNHVGYATPRLLLQYRDITSFGKSKPNRLAVMSDIYRVIRVLDLDLQLTSGGLPIVVEDSLKPCLSATELSAC